MDFRELATKRFSVRSFKTEEVGQDVLDAVLEAWRIAPTACNNQPQRIKVIQGNKDLAKLDECTPCRFGAPLALLICYDRTACWTRSFDGAKSGEVDASIVTTQLMLQAEELGLGSVWVMHFDPAKVAGLFGLSENIVPVAVLPLSYPADGALPADMHGVRKAVTQLLLD